MQNKCSYIVYLTSEKAKETGEDRGTHSYKFNL